VFSSAVGRDFDATRLASAADAEGAASRMTNDRILRNFIFALLFFLALKVFASRRTNRLSRMVANDSGSYPCSWWRLTGRIILIRGAAEYSGDYAFWHA
jgi:hypothetical protein